jgi:maltooligosyltrehalose trehalohydrolase
VRRFILDNALMWLRDYHVDGLRLDAVHALQDESVPHLLEQLAIEVDALSAHVNRPLTLIAESDLNDPKMVTPREAGGYGIDAQWTDDVHHALHSNLTGETQGYYSDFGSLPVLAKVFREAFFHNGTFSSFRKRAHGRPVDRARTPGYRFVVFLQDHDQVGNRAVGDRLPELTTPGLVKVGAVLLFTSPFTPMLWMGEEWAASTRWPFFTSHPQKELGEAVSKGRLEEFADHGWDTSAMIDPQDPAAYREAVLNWDELGQDGHGEVLDLYRRLAALRRAESDLTDPRLDRVEVEFDEDARWFVVHRGTLRVVANFAEAEQVVPLDIPGEAAVLLETDSADLADDGVRLAGHSAAVVRLS